MYWGPASQEVAGHCLMVGSREQIFLLVFVSTWPLLFFKLLLSQPVSFLSYFLSLSCWGGGLREWLGGTRWTAKVNPQQKDNTFLQWIISCYSKLYSSHHKWHGISEASYNIASPKEIWFPLQSPVETKKVWSVIVSWKEAKPIQVYEESQPIAKIWENLQRRSGGPGSQN